MEAQVFYHAERSPKVLGGGLTRTIKAYTDELMVVEVHFDQDAVGALHTHPHVQCTYILSGAFAFNINGTEKVLRAGDSASFPSNVLHGLKCIEEGSLLDIFTPAREDFLK